MEVLREIQRKIAVPKRRYNKFGGYYYRSAEDIIDAAKPLMGDCTLEMSEEVVLVGTWCYHRVIASLVSGDRQTRVNAEGWAREPESRKGMDASQMSGSTSSYAKKYALGMLFCLDDGNDPDATNDHQDRGRAQAGSPNSSAQARAAQASEEVKAFFGSAPEQVPPQVAPQAAPPATLFPPQPVPQAAPPQPVPQAAPPQAAPQPVPQPAPPAANPYPAKVDAPTKAQRDILNGLRDYYLSQVPQGYKFSTQRLANAIIAQFNRWPASVGDAEMIKKYIAVGDVTVPV